MLHAQISVPIIGDAAVGCEVAIVVRTVSVSQRSSAAVPTSETRPILIQHDTQAFSRL